MRYNPILQISMSQFLHEDLATFGLASGRDLQFRNPTRAIVQNRGTPPRNSDPRLSGENLVYVCS